MQRRPNNIEERGQIFSRRGQPKDTKDWQQSRFWKLVALDTGRILSAVGPRSQRCCLIPKKACPPNGPCQSREYPHARRFLSRWFIERESTIFSRQRSHHQTKRNSWFLVWSRLHTRCKGILLPSTCQNRRWKKERVRACHHPSFPSAVSRVPTVCGRTLHCRITLRLLPQKNRQQKKDIWRPSPQERVLSGYKITLLLHPGNIGRLKRDSKRARGSQPSGAWNPRQK